MKFGQLCFHVTTWFRPKLQRCTKTCSFVLFSLANVTVTSSSTCYYCHDCKSHVISLCNPPCELQSYYFQAICSFKNNMNISWTPNNTLKKERNDYDSKVALLWEALEVPQRTKKGSKIVKNVIQSHFCLINKLVVSLFSRTFYKRFKK